MKLDMDRSSELLNFHEAFNNLVASEEHLIEEHKSIIQADQYLLEEEKSLLAYVDDVDHDIEGGSSGTCICCVAFVTRPLSDVSCEDMLLFIFKPFL